MARKIKFQICYLFILVPKFYIFFIKPIVYLYIKLPSLTLFLKFSKVQDKIEIFKNLQEQDNNNRNVVLPRSRAALPKYGKRNKKFKSLLYYKNNILIFPHCF